MDYPPTQPGDGWRGRCGLVAHAPLDGRGSHVCSSSKGRNQRMDWERLKVNLESYNQGHLLKWLDEMTETDQRTLYDQLKDVDVVKLHKYYIYLCSH